MNTLTLIALTCIVATVSICLLIGYVVHRTGTTAGISHIALAIGSLLSAIIKAFGQIL